MRALGPLARATSLAIALAAAAATGCDGGPIGTGISGLAGTSAVAGSVAALPGAPLGEAVPSPGSAPVSIPPGDVAVSVEGAGGVPAPVAADGSFLVAGEFAGPVVLRFEAADRVVRVPVDVPPGALVLLPDVVLAKTGALLDGGRALNLLGRVVATDCAGDSLVVEIESGRFRRPLAVAIGSETRFTTQDGKPANCDAIAPGETVLVDGRLTLDPLGATSVQALGISIDGERSTIDRGVTGVSFAGTVAATDCARGLVSLADVETRGWVSLDAATAIRSEDGSGLDCPGIAIGDRVRGAGRLGLGEPDVVVADVLSVRRPGEGSADVRLAGRVVEVDCASGRIATTAHGVRSWLHLGADTALPQGIACGRIPTGAWLRGLGRIDFSRPTRRVEARRLSLWEPGMDAEPSKVD